MECITISRMTPTDIPEVKTLVNSLSIEGNGDYYFNDICLVAKFYNRELGVRHVVGCGFLYLLKKINGKTVAQIEDVVTHPSYRRNNIATEILSALTIEASKAGAYKVVLNCEESLIPFYEKCGFRKSAQQMRIDL